MSKESLLVKNTAIIAVGNLLTKCISFFMLPLYTSLLSTTDYGTVDLITTYSSLLIIIMTLQFEQGVFRLLIEARGDNNEQNKYITTSCCSVVGINVAFGVLTGIFLQAVHYEFTFYLVAIVVLGAFNGLLLQIPRGLGDNVTYALASCINGSLNVILNVLFIAVLKLKVEGMLLAAIIAHLGSGAVVIIRCKLYARIRVAFFDKTVFRQLAVYSLPLIPYTMTWWVISASDRMVIQFFLGAAANGIYAVAYKFPSLFSMVSNIFQMAWTESAAANVDTADRNRYYQSVVSQSIKFYSACNLGIIALMPFVFPWLIQTDFSEAYLYIPILMTAALFHAIAALYGSLYFAFKETSKVAYTTILSAVINIVINVVLVNRIGLYAAAISSVVAYFAIMVIRHYDIRRIAEIKFSPGYILAEIVVYILVFYSYYCQNTVLHVMVLVAVVPYCVYQNRGVLLSCIHSVKKRFVRDSKR